MALLFSLLWGPFWSWQEQVVEEGIIWLDRKPENGEGLGLLLRHHIYHGSRECVNTFREFRVHRCSKLSWGDMSWVLLTLVIVVFLSHSYLHPALCLLQPAWIWPGETCNIWLSSPPSGTSFTMRSISGDGMGLAWNLITSLATAFWMQVPWWKWLKTGKQSLRDSIVWEAPCRTLSK